MKDETPDWPLADLIAVARTTLVEHGAWATRRPYPPSPRDGADPPSLGGEDEARIYPFTKGLELTNDGIGYGEETEVTVVTPNGKEVVQRRRRTRTGSIVVTPIPEPAPRAAVTSPARPVSKPPPARPPEPGSEAR